MEHTGTFTKDQYGWLTPSVAHGAVKLAESFVAPLVAQARGYVTVLPETRKGEGAETVSEFAARANLGDYRSAQRKQLREAVLDEDVLALPWYQADRVVGANASGLEPGGVVWQFRPRNAVYNRDGEPAKYLWPFKKPSVIDIHPATPNSHTSGAGGLLITEGLRKGDAALTAQLVAHGVTVEELSRTAHDMAEARARLRHLIRTVQVDEWFTILSLVGVGTWHSHPAWNTVNVRDQRCLVAFDADAATNPQVWRQASKLVEFLAGSRHAASAELVAVPASYGDHAGVDDALGAGATWGDVLTWAVPLPPAPAGAVESHEPGDVWCDHEKGVTMKRTFDGAGTVRAAGASVRVESVNVTSTPWEPGSRDMVTHSGEVAWVNRDGNVSRDRFVDVPSAVVVSGSPETILDTLAPASAGADLPSNRNDSNDVRGAWRRTIAEASVETAFGTVGPLTVDVDGERRRVWLTSDGAIMSDGFTTSVRGRVPGLHPVQVPFVEPSDPAVVAGLSEIRADAELFADRVRGYWPAAVGQVAVAALSVYAQSRGAIILSLPAQTGKTAAMGLTTSFYGDEAGQGIAVTMNGTAAAMRDAGEGASGIVLTLDDATVTVDDQTGRPDAESLDRQKSVRAFVRATYNRAAAPLRKVATATGWRQSTIRRDMPQGVLVSTESVRKLLVGGSDPSTMQRAWAVHGPDESEGVPVRTSFLAREREIGPAVVRARRLFAPVLGAVVVDYLRRHEALTGEGFSHDAADRELADRLLSFPREWSRSRGLSEREVEVFAPLAAGWRLMSSVSGNVDAVYDPDAPQFVPVEWEDMLRLWHRHKAAMVEEFDAPGADLIRAISNAIDMRVAHWSGTERGARGDSSVEIGRCDVGEGHGGTRQPGRGDVALIPGQVAIALSAAGEKRLADRVSSILRSDLHARRTKVTVERGSRPNGYLVSRDTWEKLLDVAPAEHLPELPEVVDDKGLGSDPSEFEVARMRKNAASGNALLSGPALEWLAEHNLPA